MRLHALKSWNSELTETQLTCCLSQGLILNFECEIGVHWMWVSSQTSYFSTTRSICFLFTRRYVTTTTCSSPAIAANTSPVIFFQFILSELRGGVWEEGCQEDLGGREGGGRGGGGGGEREGSAMTGAGEGLELWLRTCSTGEANEPPELIREDIHKMDIPTKILGWKISLGLNISGHKTPSNEFFCEQNSSDDWLLPHCNHLHRWFLFW